MSQATLLVPGHSPQVASQRVRTSLPILLVAIVLSALGGALATTLLNKIAVTVDAPGAIPVPPAPLATPAVSAGGDTTVPDASVVFAGREVPIEEPAPTF